MKSISIKFGLVLMVVVGLVGCGNAQKDPVDECSNWKPEIITKEHTEKERMKILGDNTYKQGLCR